MQSMLTLAGRICSFSCLKLKGFQRLKQRHLCCIASSYIASSDYFLCLLSTATCPHEPQLSPSSNFSATHVCSGREEEWRSSGRRAPVIPQSLGTDSSHLLSDSTYMQHRGSMSCQLDNKLPQPNLRQGNRILSVIPTCPV